MKQVQVSIKKRTVEFSEELQKGRLYHRPDIPNSLAVCVAKGYRDELMLLRLDEPSGWHLFHPSANWVLAPEGTEVTLTQKA